MSGIASYVITAPFSTEISANEPDGRFDEVGHRDRIRPMWAKVMQGNGITHCFIGQHYIEVKHIPAIIRRNGVIRHLNDVMEWARSQPLLFPRRGDKVPEIVISEEAEVRRRWIQVKFTSLLTRYFPSEQGGFDRKRFHEATRGLVGSLTDLKGVTDWECGRWDAALEFDPDIAHDSDVVEHMRRVINASRLPGDQGIRLLFPYREGDEPLIEGHTVFPVQVR